jgi:hypothetical protein
MLEREGMENFIPNQDMTMEVCFTALKDRMIDWLSRGLPVTSYC